MNQVLDDITKYYSRDNTRMSHSSSMERQRRRSSSKSSSQSSSRPTERQTSSSQRRPREMRSSSSSSLSRKLDAVDRDDDARRRRVGSADDLAALFHANVDRSSRSRRASSDGTTGIGSSGSRSHGRHRVRAVVSRERDSSQSRSRSSKPPARKSSFPHPPNTPAPSSSRHDLPQHWNSPPSSSSSHRSGYSIRAANYVDRILGDESITPKIKGSTASAMNHSLLALPIAREAGGVLRDHSRSSKAEAPRHSSTSLSDRRLPDLDRIRRATSGNEDKTANRTRTRRSSAESVDDRLLLSTAGWRRRSSDVVDNSKKNKKGDPHASSTTNYRRSHTIEEEGTSNHKREDSMSISRTSAEMTRFRDRPHGARAHSQQPGNRRRNTARSIMSSTAMQSSFKSSNSFDGVRSGSGESSFLPKHSLRNQPQEGVSRRSRNLDSQDMCGPPRRSRSLSLDRCGTSTSDSLLALNKSSTTLPSGSFHSLQGGSGNRSNCPPSHRSLLPQRTIPPPQPPPRRSSVSSSSANAGASERLLLLSKNLSILKNKNRQRSHRRSSSAGLSTSDDADTEDGERMMTKQGHNTTEREEFLLDQHGIARLPPAKAAELPSRHSESDYSATPSFVSLSTQSQTTGQLSPDSSNDIAASCPQAVPFRSTRRSSDNPPPPPPPPRPLNRRPSTQRDTMLSSLESSKLMMSSCPTLNIQAQNEFGNNEIRNVAVPPAVICSNNDTDTKSNKQLNNNIKCSRKVSKMVYTDPFGDSGLYTGEVDEESRPHGKGKMKYDNGIFFEGTWYYGCKNDVMGPKNNGISTMGGASSSHAQQDGSTRERILSGFTSWKGKKKTDPSGNGEMGRFVYGMEWVDPSGLSGKYTGRVNDADVPDGKGVMRYHFGLIAEGDWIKGVLNNGAGAGVNPIVPGNSGIMSGGMSVAPGMSVAGGAGAMSVVSGLGMMSIGGGGGAMGGMGGVYPPTPSVAAGVYNSMVNPYANMMALSLPTPFASVSNSMGTLYNPVGYFPQRQQMINHHQYASPGPGNNEGLPPS